MITPARSSFPSLHTVGVMSGIAAGAWLGSAEAPTKLVTMGFSPFVISLGMVMGVFVARWTIPVALKGTGYVFDDLRQVGVSILTIGQYLRPSLKHAPMERYYHPDEFKELKRSALARGFVHVESGPLVRSSYHAHEQADAYASAQPRL